MDSGPYKPGDTISGRYRIESVVGSGPLGWVFRARDTQLEVEVALKSIHPHLVQAVEERAHFSKVMRLARRVSHQNLLRVYEEGEDSGRPFFTSQFVEGRSLREMLDQRQGKAQPFTLDEAEPLLAQMAEALEAIHKALPHGDFKPANVVLMPDLLKLTDVGLGGAIPPLPFVQAQKQARVDRYFAPEAREAAEASLELAADVFSLAVVMGEMLTGLTPQDGEVPELSRRAPLLPFAIDGLYRKALSQNPMARFKTPMELVAELGALRTRSAAASRPGHHSPVPPPASAAASQPTVAERRPAMLADNSPTQAMETPGWMLSGGLDSQAAATLPGILQVPAHDHSAAATEVVRALPGMLPPLPTAEPVRAAASAPVPAFGAGQRATARRVSTEPLRTPAFPQLVPAPGVAAPLQGTRRRGRKRSVAWLLLLALIGVGVGVGAGMLLLRGLRPSPTVAPLSATDAAGASAAEAP